MSGFYWIASYLKSGNTWLRLALHSVRSGEPLDFSRPLNFAPVATLREELEQALGVHSSDLTDAEVERLRPLAYTSAARALRTPQFRKVHDAWTRTSSGEPVFPLEATAGTLYVVRDPRDVAISLAHFSEISIDEAIDQLGQSRTTHVDPRPRLDEQLPYHLHTWSEHVVSWLDAPGRPCCLLRYEDMLSDPVQTLMRATSYCGLTTAADAIADAVSRTRFDVLAAQESAHGFHGASGSAAPFFRRGEAGQWRQTLNAHQIARIERDHGGVMQRLGYL